MFFTTPSKLRAAGVVGINARNAAYVIPQNKRSLYPLVDDKSKTKVIAVEAGLAVPELYGIIEQHSQIRRLRKTLGDRTSFVVKPAQGSQGNGIMVIEDRVEGGWRKVGGSSISDSDFNFYLSNIISGMYSLAGRPDKALIEYRVEFDPVFDQITYKGVPDIRVVVYRGIPVMAMLRLPTRASDGKANLHKAGIGAGVDMATGITLGGVQNDMPVDVHPDTGSSIQGLQIPGWDTILDISTRSADAAGLGYMGVDIVLDKNLGPLILELNARPGLAIQIANSEGLRHRLDKVDAVAGTMESVEERLDFVRRTFGVLPTAE
ncbi:alpha-L-glutamate ligase-like protein [Rhodobacteraceae bacterium RKSG542]|uniref:alpha-L-glutamate ligase-like protein n=1 Tax=Pseudovibrio flavus TaxID=2529854 RepID=UPI0012BC3854|nr:alpha-L-glutamate ligase-like protein [Pseudovibrio flavus]MTI16878.1 alpha-L-glutamate ligase-like protein [Pseudovibrio flavus]